MNQSVVQFCSFLCLPSSRPSLPTETEETDGTPPDGDERHHSRAAGGVRADGVALNYFGSWIRRGFHLFVQ
jgi:hypothetical protein